MDRARDCGGAGRMARRDEGEYPSWIFDLGATKPAARNAAAHGRVQVATRPPTGYPQPTRRHTRRLPQLALHGLRQRPCRARARRLEPIRRPQGAPDFVWLPPVLPENARLIASLLPVRPLDGMQKRNWRTLKVELLSNDERRKLIAEYIDSQIFYVKAFII